jgi:hypothetical protein
LPCHQVGWMPEPHSGSHWGSAGHQGSLHQA